MTRTQEFVDARWNRGGQPETFSKRAHIHFASDLIGTHLMKSKSSKEVLQAWFSVLSAHHKEAYTKDKTLHCDISHNNILLKPDGEGLNDWDLAKTLYGIEAGSHRPTRYGTWQFMSIRRLGHPNEKPAIQDDLESFFWVLLYVTIRYLATSLGDSGGSIPCVMQTIFDTAVSYGAKIIGGAYKKEVVLDRQHIEKDFYVKNNMPLTDLVNDILRIVRPYVRYWQDFDDEVERLVDDEKMTVELATEHHLAKKEDLKLSSHVAMVDLILKALAKDWPTGDNPSDHCALDETMRCQLNVYLRMMRPTMQRDEGLNEL